MKEPLILTVTGRRVNPLNIRFEDICEEDIAHHLACINRFNGATIRPITVAQHAVYVSRLLDGTGLEWQGLHHDDGEAYVGDVTKWLKHSPEMKPFRDAEERAQRMCYTFWGVPPAEYEGYPDLMHPLVRMADKMMVRFEGGEGFSKKVWKAWSEEVVTLQSYPHITQEELGKIGPWRPWSWRQSKEAYLTRLRSLRLDGRDRRSAQPTTV